MSKLDKDKLISAVYSATLSPDFFDEILDTFDELIFSELARDHSNDLVGQPGALCPLGGDASVAIDPELLAHFQRAHDIQLRFGRNKAEKPKLQVLIDAAPNPAFIFDSGEKIVAMNDLAKGLVPECCPKLADCFANPDILATVREFVTNKAHPKILVEPGYINSQQNMNTCILVKKIGGSSDDGVSTSGESHEDLYFFSIVDLGFDPSKTALFREAYGLTPAEVDIAVHLASGKQLPEIAEVRGATLTTVRTQVKRIKTKTNSRDIPAIVRLLCGFSAGILISSQLPNPVSAVAQNTPARKSPEQIVLRDGRKMSYLEQGDPTGSPVIMIHNMPYGVELPELAIEAASRMNLRILSPFRPGYGNSDLIEAAHGDQLLDEVATDMFELLDRLSIEKAVIVGQTIGTAYALRFARLYPERVSDLLAVSHTPMWRDKWLAKMPKRQRFILGITKYMPQLLPLVTHAAVAFIDKGHAGQLFRATCKESAADMRALNNPEIVELMAKGCEEGLKQGAEAFRRDCFLAVKDFSEEAKQLTHSFHVLHGDDDQIIELSRSQDFADCVPGTELEIVKGAGQLLIYSHWEHVLKAIKNKLK